MPLGANKAKLVFCLYVMQLERVIGESSTYVDWRRSFYLNLIAHTSFRVTVAICKYVHFVFVSQV